MRLNRQLKIVALLVLSMSSFAAQADQVAVAVASNALKALQAMKVDFEKQTGHTLRISSGSTGKLYAQIINGAPYDIFLAANAREPQHLEQNDMIVKGSRFTYARGRLALCSTRQPLDEASAKQLLSSTTVGRVALASPKTAPYGAAAKAVLEKLGVWSKLQGKLVQGENISQAYQFTVSGNVEMGFVAVAQIWNKQDTPLKKCWFVPEEYHPALEQQAVWLKRAAENPAASAFIDYLKSVPALTILRLGFGYGT